MTRRAVLALVLASTLTGCAAAGGPAPSATSSDAPIDSPARLANPADTFTVENVAAFDEPWAMAFLPDARALVTQRAGALLLVDPAAGSSTRVAGTPDVVVDGQGGLGDVILGPNFATDRTVYLSWVEAGEGGTGAVVGRATLRADNSPALEGLTVIWRQEPKVTGSGHFSHRMVFSPDGRYLFVSSGDRQKFDPAQDLGNNLGTIVRLTADGAPAAGNPVAGRGAVSAQIWSYGHRNVLGLAFDAHGNLWNSEMGPQGGDEINLIAAGKNYGWPRASNGSHYGGADIPDHANGDGFEAPKVWWNPSISPGSLMIYSGDRFAGWKGDAFVGALSGRALIRVHLDGTNAAKADQWDMGARIREVEQGPDGALWLLTDGGDGRLLKLTPKT
ncbi:MAG: PQQ-dependent sugar dehydrogenase [Dermatophilaceae bacterium]